MKAHSFLPGFALLLFLVACGGEKDEKEQNVSQVLKSEDPTVDVMVLHRGDFLRELIANGNVVAARKADLRFSSAEPITDIYVSNGDRVKKGQKLARIDTYKLEADLLAKKSALDRAYLDLQDELIGRGYNIRDTASVPQQEMQLLRVKSGYDTAESSYQLALRAYRDATLYAPFDGDGSQPVFQGTQHGVHLRGFLHHRGRRGDVRRFFRPGRRTADGRKRSGGLRVAFCRHEQDVQRSDHPGEPHRGQNGAGQGVGHGTRQPGRTLRRDECPGWPSKTRCPTSWSCPRRPWYCVRAGAA